VLQKSVESDTLSKQIVVFYVLLTPVTCQPSSCISASVFSVQCYIHEGYISA